MTDPDPAMHATMKTLLVCMCVAIAFLFATRPAFAHKDWQCVSPAGCLGMKPTDQGLRHMRFKPGDIICPSSGWMPETMDGWVRIKGAPEAPIVSAVGVDVEVPAW